MALTPILILVAAMSLVTLACKTLPFLVLGNRPLPTSAKIWLSYVPTAVLCAMLIPTILVQSGHLRIDPSNHLLLATLPALWTGVRYKNVSFTVIVGMLSLALIRHL